LSRPSPHAPRPASDIRLGLDRVRRALAFLGAPENAFASVLIAGTNGKGSVSALVESAARTAGLVTGHFTSPHLLDVRERVRVGGDKIPEPDWNRLSDVIDGLPSRLGLTEFERQTLLAFLFFAEKKVELAVVETGLGGRLDAANVLPAPEACVIASIGHDHREWLGSTPGKIYFEKRGIARPGVPLVQAPPRSLWLAGDRDLTDRAVPCWTLGREIRLFLRGTDWIRRRQRLDVFLPGARYNDLEIGLLGDHQARNAALAASVCVLLNRCGWPLTESAVRRGFARARWPGRFQLIAEKGRPDVILDGAHNAEAVEALVKVYRSSPWARRKAVLIFGCLKDKDASSMAGRLLPLIRRVVLCPLPSLRARLPTSLRSLWRGKDVQTAGSAEEALRLASSDGGPVLTAGSLYLAGEIMRVLEVDLE